MPQRWSRPGLDGGLAGARAGRAARNGARARASHGEGGVEGKYSKEQGGRVSKMAVDRALSRGHAGHGRREGVSAALCPARMRNACGICAKLGLDLRSACVWYYVVCSRFWQESALHVALGGFIRDRDRRFYRITIVEVSDLIVIAHPPWRSHEPGAATSQARPRGRHGQRHARPGNLSGNVTRAPDRTAGRRAPRRTRAVAMLAVARSARTGTFVPYFVRRHASRLHRYTAVARFGVSTKLYLDS